MNSKSVTDTYFRETVENAPPVKLLRMLYQGAIRSLTQAIEAGPGAKAFLDGVFRTDEIVTELRLALRPELAADLCEQLESLYVFVEGQLIEAQRETSVEPLKAARSILGTLAEAWNQVDPGKPAEPSPPTHAA